MNRAMGDFFLTCMMSRGIAGRIVRQATALEDTAWLSLWSLWRDLGKIL